MRTQKLAYVVFANYVRNHFYNEQILNLQRERFIDVAAIAKKADFSIVSDVILNPFFFISDEKFSNTEGERKDQYYDFLSAQFNLAHNLMCRCDELWIVGDVEIVDAVEELRWFHRHHKPVRHFDNSGKEIFSHLNQPLGVN